MKARNAISLAVSMCMFAGCATSPKLIATASAPKNATSTKRTMITSAKPIRSEYQDRTRLGAENSQEIDKVTQEWTLREQPGSVTSISVDNKNQAVAYSNSVSGANWTCGLNTLTPVINLPHAYKAADSEVTYDIARDGRHVSDIGADGKILWSRDPFMGSYLDFYGLQRPRIAFFALTENEIRIVDNSSQMWTIDIKTGTLTLKGH